MAPPLSAGLMVKSLRVRRVVMVSVSIGVRLLGVGLAAVAALHFSPGGGGSIKMAPSINNTIVFILIIYWQPRGGANKFKVGGGARVNSFI